MRRTGVFVLLLLSEGTLLLWTLRLAGGAVQSAYDGRIPDFLLWRLGPWLLLLLWTLFLRFRKVHRAYPRHGLFVGVVLLMMLATAMLWSGLRLEQKHSFVPELGLFLHRPGEGATVCPSRDPCWRYTIDQHGLRNPPGRARPDGEPAVALVGDSFVFGVGVNDGQTLAAELERRLARANGAGIRVVSAGIPGASMASFPALARYAVERYGVAAVVVVMNYGDVVLRDVTTRMRRVRDQLGWRLLAALDLEIVWEHLFWMRSIPPVPDAETRAGLITRLDELRDACAGRRLLLVTDWPAGYLPLLEEWMAHNPRVGWFDVTGHPGWRGAETLPHDAHWSPRGIERIASLLLEPVRKTLAQEQDAVRGGPPLDEAGARAGKTRLLPDLSFLPAGEFSQSRPPGQPEILMLGVRLEDGRVELRVEWCGENRSAFAVGRVCFSYLEPIRPQQDLAVRGALEPYGAALRALSP